MARDCLPLSTVEVNGYRFSYQVLGHGEPLVLVHGHLCDYRTWNVLQSKLSYGFQVYSYSKRFAWPNEAIKDGEPQPWEQDAMDLGGFIEALNLSPAHILGNSSGSTIALLLARAKPHLVKTLVLEEPPLITLFLPCVPPTALSVLYFLLRHPITFWPVMYYSVTTVVPAQAWARKGNYCSTMTTFGRGALGPQRWANAIADPERNKQLQDNTKWLVNFMRYSELPKYLASDARAIQQPTLVITGEDGPYFQQCIDGELLRICGAARKKEVVIEKAGHLMHEDNPERVCEEVSKFIKAGQHV